MANAPLIVLTQGDPAGVGPELCLRVAARWLADPTSQSRYRPLLVMERRAFDSVERLVPSARLEWVEGNPLSELSARCRAVSDRGAVAAIEPGAEVSGEPLSFGQPHAADAEGALGAIDRALELCSSGVAAAMVTAPINKATIHQHVEPGFRGHTDYLASRSFDHAPRYGRDYLMAFLGEQLNVALLTAHLPLLDALRSIQEPDVVDALRCLHRATRRQGGQRIALAGLNPHAGEGGLLGSEEQAILAPAVSRARAEGINVTGPESADTLFARACSGAFDWVLALYHDQGLIAVKTLAFGATVNWTAGLPVVRTSVDHGTAYDLAGRGTADPSALFAAIDAAVRLAERSQPEPA